VRSGNRLARVGVRAAQRLIDRASQRLARRQNVAAIERDDGSTSISGTSHVKVAHVLAPAASNPIPDGPGGRPMPPMCPPATSCCRLGRLKMSADDAGRTLLAELRDKTPASNATLFPLVYAELRRLAHHYLSRERPGHTLQATALVHEVYLRLIPQGDATWEDRAKFVGIAAHVMREILVEYARSRGRIKRGGERERIPLAEDVGHLDADFSRWEDLDRALDRLAELDPRQAKVVELRYIGGLTVEEAAQVLGVSPKTVKRDWSVARAWLRRELGA
jgi:RNA polymerase sigma factor (TIGR02999 family)